jgi:hypothetical protein
MLTLWWNKDGFVAYKSPSSKEVRDVKRASPSRPDGFMELGRSAAAPTNGEPEQAPALATSQALALGEPTSRAKTGSQL